MCNEFYQSKKSAPDVINITSASAGTISPINPNVKVERDQKISFDLSDSSLSFSNNEVAYSAFEFNLYDDSNLTSKFFTSGQTDDFNVSEIGRIGIDATSAVTIKNVEEINKDLYYNLTPINDTLNTDVKKEIIRDSVNNINPNSLTLTNSPLSGHHTIVGVGTTTFAFSAQVSPEKLNYVASDGKLTYSTDGNDAYGPIESILITSQGSGYKSLPGISTIISDFGDGAILKAKSNGIGRISVSYTHLTLPTKRV